MLRLLPSDIKKSIFNISWLTFEQFIRLSFALVIGVIIARHLGPQAFGELNFALSFVGLFVAFSSLGLDNVVVKRLVDNSHHTKINTTTADITEKILGTSFVLKLLGACSGFIFILLLLESHLISFSIGSDIVYVLAMMAFFQATNTVDFFFQAKSLNKYVVMVKIVQTFLIALLRIFLIISNANLIWFAWAYLFDAVILSIGLLLIFQKYSGSSFLFWKWDYSLAVSLLTTAWPLILSSLVISIYMKVDQVMIEHYIGTTEVGIYAAASRLSEISYVIPLIIVTALFPSIIRAKLHSISLYHSRMRHIYSLMFISSMMVVLPIAFFSDNIIFILYGDAFSGSAKILAIHIWTCIFVFFGMAMNRWVLTEKLQKQEFYYLFAGMLTNIVLNMSLIPSLGAEGAAWATLLSQFAANLCYPLFFGHKFRLQIKYQITSINFIPRLINVCTGEPREK